MMSHEVARHVRYNTKLKALQRTPHHMIISRVRILLERLRDTPAAAPGSGKAVDEQVTVFCFTPAVVTRLTDYHLSDDVHVSQRLLCWQAFLPMAGRVLLFFCAADTQQWISNCWPYKGYV